MPSEKVNEYTKKLYKRFVIAGICFMIAGVGICFAGCIFLLELIATIGLIIAVMGMSLFVSRIAVEFYANERDKIEAEAE